MGPACTRLTKTWGILKLGLGRCALAVVRKQCLELCANSLISKCLFAEPAWGVVRGLELIVFILVAVLSSLLGVLLVHGAWPVGVVPSSWFSDGQSSSWWECRGGTQIRMMVGGQLILAMAMVAVLGSSSSGNSARSCMDFSQNHEGKG